MLGSDFGLFCLLVLYVTLVGLFQYVGCFVRWFLYIGGALVFFFFPVLSFFSVDRVGCFVILLFWSVYPFFGVCLCGSSVGLVVFAPRPSAWLFRRLGAVQSSGQKRFFVMCFIPCIDFWCLCGPSVGLVVFGPTVGMVVSSVWYCSGLRRKEGTYIITAVLTPDGSL